jgi:hypothetical protein
LVKIIKFGPPEEGEETITDEGLGYMLLGCLRAVPHFKDFPIKVRGVIDNFDNEGTIKSFTIITESGLGYTVSLTFDGRVDEDGNPE